MPRLGFLRAPSRAGEPEACTDSHGYTAEPGSITCCHSRRKFGRIAARNWNDAGHLRPFAAIRPHLSLRGSRAKPIPGRPGSLGRNGRSGLDFRATPARAFQAQIARFVARPEAPTMRSRCGCLRLHRAAATIVYFLYFLPGPPPIFGTKCHSVNYCKRPPPRQ